MKFSIRFADQIVGALVILALAILVVVVFMLGKSQRWFTHDYQYKTYLNSASGLSPNMALQYKGFTIGHVKKIMLAEDDSVEVLFIIFEEHNHRVKEGSVVELQASPIAVLGNAFIFHPGKGTEIITEGSTIPEKNSPRAKQLIAMELVDMPEASDSINNIINQVNMLLETINVSLAGSEGSEELPLGQILANVEMVTSELSDKLTPILTNLETLTGDLSERISPILTNVETITDQLADPSGTVMSILDSEGPIYSDIVELLNSVTDIINSLERVIEFIPAKLPQISLLLSDLHSTLTEAEKLIVALTNNPLLKGGVPELQETGPGAATPRDLEF